MAALDKVLKSNIRLIDYEKITDKDGNRLIAFGKYAGMAGAIDFLKGFGEYIMQMGISTPFLHCNCAYKYFDVADCYAHLRKIGEKIKEKEIPKELSPMIFAVTGRGRTAQGVLEVLENLPIKYIKAEDFEKFWETKDDPIHRKTIYVVNINTEDCIVPRDPDAKFDKADFYKNPSKYRSVFKERFLPYVSALFHCIYWEGSFPKYIKNKHLYNLANTSNLRLIGICDVKMQLGR
jgi:alpha-aminoadipic semialdehyde synthase